MADDKIQIETNEESMISKHGHILFCKYWKPSAMNKNVKPKHLVFISHGAAEHCQRYNKIAPELAQHNNLVFSHDHVGHGKSEGDRMHVNDFSVYVDDVIGHVEKIKKEYQDVPCFIFGYSMGGVVAILTALKIPDMINGLILAGPAVMMDSQSFPAYSVVYAKIMGSIFPQHKLWPLNADWMCRDKEVVQDYKEDELIWHEGLKAKFVCCLMNGAKEVWSRLSELKTPFLLVHGTGDKLCKVEGSRQLYEKATCEDKTFKTYEGGYHEVFNEIDGQGDQVIHDIIEWIDKR